MRFMGDFFTKGLDEIFAALGVRGSKKQVFDKDGFAQEATALATAVMRSSAPRDPNSRVHEADRIHFFVTADKAGTVSRRFVIQNGEHLLYTMTGTRPHLIRSKSKKKPLSWTGRGGQKFAFFVMHPGTEANDWYDDALEIISPAIEYIRQKYLRRMRGEE